MRKKAVRLSEGAPADMIDSMGVHTATGQLMRDHGHQIHVGPGLPGQPNGAARGQTREALRHVVTHFK